MASEDLLLIELKSGRRVAIPIEGLQDLADADRALVATVELDEMYGSYLHWEELNVDFSIVGLADGRYGSERWMAALPVRQQANAAAAFEDCLVYFQGHMRLSHIVRGEDRDELRVFVRRDLRQRAFDL